MTLRNRPLRSALYIPGDKPRAIAKAASLPADAVIFDLEDAVAPDNKAAAREALREHFRAVPHMSKLRVIRINGLNTAWGTEDLMAARACRPDAVLLPKVSHAGDVAVLQDALNETDAPDSLRVWAMIETPQGVANCAALAQEMAAPDSRLDCLVAGTNDLAKDTGLPAGGDRSTMVPWLMQIVLGARAGGLAVLDGVFNDHADLDGFSGHCTDGAARGFDGVTVIHPGQIAVANQAYAPSTSAISAAKAIVDAFALPANAEKGVIAIDGRMVERLHLEQAQALLAKHARMGEEP